MDKKLRWLKLRVMRLKPLEEIPESRRGKARELLVEYQLLAYGETENPVKEAYFVGDKICIIELENGTVKRVPIEVKPPWVKIGKNFLNEFKGIYVIIIQPKESVAEYDFLVFTSREMYLKVHKKGTPGIHDKAHKEKRWHLRIPNNHKGFEEYVDRWNKIVDYAEGRE